MRDLHQEIYGLSGRSVGPHEQRRLPTTPHAADSLNA